MTTREQLNHERLQALFRIICDDGVTSPGEVCPAYAARVRTAADLNVPRRLADKHREGVPASEVDL